MMLLGVDYYPNFQQVAFLAEETRVWERQLKPAHGEAERFYREAVSGDNRLVAQLENFRVKVFRIVAHI
jgi:hypothetical protein